MDLVSSLEINEPRLVTGRLLFWTSVEAAFVLGDTSLETLDDSMMTNKDYEPTGGTGMVSLGGSGGGAEGRDAGMSRDKARDVVSNNAARRWVGVAGVTMGAGCEG